MTIPALMKKAVGSAWLASPQGRFRLRQQGMILMLHRVLADDAAAALPHRGALCVGAGAFEHLLVWLKQRFDCVSLEDLLTVQSGARPRVALTFDDGWRDNADQAFPLLLRYGVPATVFLATDFIGTSRRFWWEAVGESLWGEVDKSEELLAALVALGQVVPEIIRTQDSSAERSRAIGNFLQKLKTLSPACLDKLTQACPPQQHKDALDWHQVGVMEASGLVRFGSHGAGHAILTQLAPSAVQADLQRADESLKRQCQHPLGVFCYPNGDHSAQVRSAVAVQGYAYALTTRPGLVGNDTDPLRLPRIDVSHAAARDPALLGWRLYRGGKR